MSKSHTVGGVQVYNTWPSTESAMASRAELRTKLGKAI